MSIHYTTLSVRIRRNIPQDATDEVKDMSRNLELGADQATLSMSTATMVPVLHNE